MARELAAGDGLSLLCGRYEGVDQRVVDHLVDGELSIGDYVLAGGEAAALVVVEAVARLVPGVMGNEASAVSESFSEGLLEEPQYTRPPTSGAGSCPRSCARATTAASPGGGGPRRWPARRRPGPTSSRKRRVRCVGCADDFAHVLHHRQSDPFVDRSVPRTSERLVGQPHRVTSKSRRSRTRSDGVIPPISGYPVGGLA